jgi:hypothetical protein
MKYTNRIRDSKLLFETGRVEGAFLNILLAISAAARIKYSKPIHDSVAFSKYLENTEAGRYSFEFRGKPEKLSKILYKWMRCEMAHEGTLPIDIKIVPDKERSKYWIQAGGGVEKTLKISRSFFHVPVDYALGRFHPPSSPASSAPAPDGRA